MDDQGNGHGDQKEEDRAEAFSGYLFPPADRSCQGVEHDQVHGQQQQRMQGSAEILVMRGHKVEAGGELGDPKQYQEDDPLDDVY